jgi:hypothetical protein
MKCLVIMSFARQFDPIYDTIKKSVSDAMRLLDLETLRLDEVRTAGKITSQLIDALRSADFYIADITQQSANVMWEVGFAAAIGRPTILISQLTGPLPFDIQDERVVRYDPRRLDQTLYVPLKEAVRATLSVVRPLGRTIAVTGTSTISPDRAFWLLSALIDPYLSRHMVWYCGTTGTTDEAALQLLLQKGEDVRPISDSIYRVTPIARELMLKFNTPLTDAEYVMKQDSSDAFSVSAVRPIDLTLERAETTLQRAAHDDSAMLNLLLERAGLLVLLGSPEVGRTMRLVQGATARKTPYLLALP